MSIEGFAALNYFGFNFSNPIASNSSWHIGCFFVRLTCLQTVWCGFHLMAHYFGVELPVVNLIHCHVLLPILWFGL